MLGVGMMIISKDSRVMFRISICTLRLQLPRISGTAAQPTQPTRIMIIITIPSIWTAFNSFQ